MVLACTGALLFGGLTVPPGSLPTLDKVVAVLETVLTWSAAYPASVAFGRVLLQTAPPQRAVQIISLDKSLKEVEAHPLFVFLRVRRLHFSVRPEPFLTEPSPLYSLLTSGVLCTTKRWLSYPSPDRRASTLAKVASVRPTLPRPSRLPMPPTPPRLACSSSLWSSISGKTQAIETSLVSFSPSISIPSSCNSH